jgi:pimeloyl-ACP methyl ester carboxylesterase
VERFVEVPGGRLFAASDGQGPPLLLLHAAIVDSRAWDAVVPGLAAAGYTVIRYDMRGFGRSTTEDIAFSDRDDLRAVLDAFGVTRAAVVGNSRGGNVALDTAIESPDRVVAVVTLGTAPGGFQGSITDLEKSYFAEGEALEQAPQPDAAALADFMVRLWVDGPGQPATRVPAAVRASVRAWALPLYQPGHVAGRRIALEPPANGRLAELGCPALAVVGGLDLAYLVGGAHRLENAAPNGRAVIWPDVAHMIGLEQPDRLVSLVTEFVAPLRPWE